MISAAAAALLIPALLLAAASRAASSNSGNDVGHGIHHGSPDAGSSSGTTEHKVHNIVLYPERHSWCQTTPIKQVVSMPGYEPVTVDNSICVGACYSYAIPRTQPAEPGQLLGPYCDSCQPKDTECYHVTLRSSNGTTTIRKKVQIIRNCNCATCFHQQQHDDQSEQLFCDESDEDTAELPISLLSQSSSAESNSAAREDKPELLNIANHNHKNADSSGGGKFDIDVALKQVLHSIRENQDTQDDWLKLRLLLQLPEESTQMALNLVRANNVTSADELRALLKHRNLQEKLMETNSIHDVTDNTADETDDDDDGEGGIQLGLADQEAARLGMGHLKGTHFAMGLHSVHHNNNNKAHKSIAHRQPNEHLTLGPHGSLVVVEEESESSEQRQQEELDLSSGELRPNVEGMVVAYEDHHRRRKHHLQQRHPKIADENENFHERK